MFGDIRNTQGELLDYAYHPGQGDGRAAGLVVIGHGVTGNKDRPFVVALAEGLTAAGIDALRFSFAGNGDSEGRFEDCTISKEVDDLGSVLDAVGALDAGARPVAFIGHSMGGIVARHMQREWSNAGESAPPLVTIGTPHGGMDVLDLAHKSPRAHNLLTTFMGRAVPALASCRTEDHPSVAATTLCITSHWPSLTALVQGWDDGVVPVKDQVLEGSRSLSIGRCPHALSVLMPSTMHAVTEFVLARPG